MSPPRARFSALRIFRLCAALACTPALPFAAEFDVMEKSIPELQDAMQKGEVTSRRLVEYYLARIAAYDQQGPKLNTIITLNARALETARALDAERKAYPAGHPDIALAAMEVGRTEAARRNSGGSIPLLREALDIRRKVFGDGSWKSAEARLYLAEALAAAGQAAEALPLLEQAIPALREQRGPDCRLTREAEIELERLAPQPRACARAPGFGILPA